MVLCSSMRSNVTIQREVNRIMKALRILLVVAVSMMMVGSAFAEVTFDMGARADYNITVESAEIDDADAVTVVKIGDGGRVQFLGNASKELDNGATAELEGTLHLETGGAEVDWAQFRYINGPLTVSMLNAERPGTFKKGMDLYIPEAAGDPGRYQNDYVEEQGVCFQYAGEGMEFATTLNVHGDNRIGVRPYVEMAAGPATIRGAVEYASEFPEDTDADGPTANSYGGGASVVADLGTIEVSVSAAYGIEGGTDDAGDDIDETAIMSAYAYATMAVGAGEIGVMGGYNMETVDNVDDDAIGVQGHVSYEQGDIIVPGLKLTVSAGFGSATDHSDVDSTVAGGKLRLRYSY